jgi:Holliday junction resolvase RusA-like endonuclease
MKLKQFTLLIPGNPIAKARARKGRNGFYNSQSVEMRKAQLLIKRHLPEKFEIIPAGIPVIVNATFFFEPAKSQRTKNFIELIQNENYPYIKKPDRDNCDKFLLDILSGIIFHDDNQIYGGQIFKLYTPDNPRTEIEIEIIW